MDPHTEKAPGLALPKPAQEQGGFNAMPMTPGVQPEASLPSVEAGVLPSAPVMAMPQVQPAAAQQPVPVAPPALPPAPMAATQVTDDNTDALDEEWINKAKAIVEQTKHDPHLESQELSRVKADYLRIRYNKQIKVAEDNK
jgi:hypothetical protein